MGSCISTKKPTKTTPPPSQQPKHQHLQDRTLVPESDPPAHPKQTTTTRKTHPSLRSPPPPPEEETVKEVLSETPTPKPKFSKYQNQQKILRLPSFPKLEEQKNPPFEEISEVSEICSVTESVSTSALTERSREFEEVMQPRIMDQSPSKIRRKRSDSVEFYGRGESPVRRSDQWLGGRTDITGKSVYSKELGQMFRQPNGLMRDQGESSRRRSRSPATRIDTGASRPGGMCRSPSGKRVVRSSGRSPVKSSEIGRNLEEAKEGKRPVRESLEDPLVSLECFIFL